VEKESLTKKWSNLFKSLFDPLVITFFIIYCFIFILVSNADFKKEYFYVYTILNVLGSIFLALSVTKLRELLFKTAESKILEQKGRSAFRNLMQILNTCGKFKNAIEDWLLNDSKPTISQLQETKRTLESINDNIINSIEDWNDILPEANISDIINDLKDKETRFQDLQLKLSELEKYLKESHDDKAKLSIDLEKSKDESNKLLQEILKIKSHSGINYGTSGFSGVNNPSDVNYHPRFLGDTGKIYPRFLGDTGKPD
jgi:hypothetical protein